MLPALERGVRARKGRRRRLATLGADTTDYKRLIALAKGTAEKLDLAQKLGTRRLACGVLPELDACFAALDLHQVASPSTS
jgi:hypothetical protein